MKTHDPFEVFYTKQGENINVISFTLSRSGVVRAWLGYSDHCIGMAGGYGYDKLSTALVSALQVLYKTEIDGSGAGWRAVVKSAKTKGIKVFKQDELAWEAFKNK